MTALAIIEHLNIFKDRCLSGLMCVIILQIDQCGFSGMEETLGHSIIPTVALPTHTGLHPVLSKELPIAVGAILAATVRMHDEARGGLPLADRHGQRLVHQFCSHMLCHPPP